MFVFEYTKCNKGFVIVVFPDHTHLLFFMIRFYIPLSEIVYTFQNTKYYIKIF